MSLFSQFFPRKKTSAPVARERLQILLAHERKVVQGKGPHADLLANLHKEILEVIQRHVSIDHDKVQIKLDRGDVFSTLEIDIEVPQDEDSFRAISHSNSEVNTVINTKLQEKKPSTKKNDKKS